MKKDVSCNKITVTLLIMLVLFISCKGKNEKLDDIRETKKLNNTENIHDSINTSKKEVKADTLIYKSIKIGEQVWMMENLNRPIFRNGDSILHAKTGEEWEMAGHAGIPAWCYYQNSEEKGRLYGKLYNWYAVSDKRGLAPEGWIIPTGDDWQHLINTLGGINVAALDLMGELKWKHTKGLNGSGFNAIPSGGRFVDGKFENLLTDAYYWSSSLSKSLETEEQAVCFILNPDLPIMTTLSKSYGLSVRCIKDEMEE